MLSIFKVILQYKVIILVAVVVRLIAINQSFWLDEAAQALESTRPLGDQWRIVDDFQPPLFHLIVHFFTYVSVSEWWLRLASLIPGVATVWYTIKIAEDLFSKEVAKVSGLLLAVSQFHIFYSQELRPYSLAAFLATYSTYHLYRYVMIKHQASLLKSVIANTLGLYTMYVFPLFIITQLVVVIFFHRNRLKAVLLGCTLSGLFFLPWLPMFIRQLQAGTELLSTLPGWSVAVSPALIKMIPLTAIKLTLGRIDIDPILTDILPILVLWLSMLYLVFMSSHITRIKRELIVFIVIPIILALGISIKIPILDPKRVLFILPFICILVASGVKKELRSNLAIILVFFIFSLSMVRYWTNPRFQREPWRQAIQEIESLTDTNTLMMFAFTSPLAPYEWYEKSHTKTFSLVPKNLSDSELISRLGLINHYDTIITFDYLTDLTDPDRRLQQVLLSHGYSQKLIKDYRQIGFIRFFTRGDALAFSAPPRIIHL